MSNYIDTTDLNIEILDANNDFVKLKGVLKNSEISNWTNISLNNKTQILATNDHPFITQEGKTIVDDLIVGDCLFDNKDNKIKITKKEPQKITQDSFDVETETDTFMCSGIQSHNCRAAVNIDYSPHIYGKFNIG